jgi:N-dimethylarginine dimethylaminohydrolase
MTEPRHFTVCYRINPWMTPTVVTETAHLQWKQLVEAIEASGAQVTTMPDVEGLPDMAFTMNAGFVFGDKAVPSTFRHPERRPEKAHWTAWFEANGYEIVDLDLPEGAAFEAGDAFLVGDVLVAAWGFRSDQQVPAALARVTGRRHVEVRLVDERFYHFDTCFCPLGSASAMIFPDAIAADDRHGLLDVITDPIFLTEAEALTLCANSLVIGDNILMSTCPPRVGAELAARGFTVTTVDVGEFHKSGGSVRCLTLPLDLPAGPGPAPAAPGR